MDKKKYIRLAVISGIIVIVDQITKALIIHKVAINHSISVVSDFFYITHILNPGGAFGFLANQPSLIRVIVFIVFSLIAIGLIFYLYTETPETHVLLSAGLAMIFGGAVGNMIDRLRFGEVVDFLLVYIPFIPLNIFNPWPAFNVADSGISVGMTIFVGHIIFNKMPYKNI